MTGTWLKSMFGKEMHSPFVLLVVFALGCVPDLVHGDDQRAYELKPGDRIEVTVETVVGHEDLSGEFEVDDTGHVSFPMILNIEAGGLTTQALEDAITTKLKPDYLKNPIVRVRAVTPPDPTGVKIQLEADGSAGETQPAFSSESTEIETESVTANETTLRLAKRLHRHDVPSNAAFPRLISLWGVSLEDLPAKPTCESIEALEMRCTLREGTWDEIRLYNHPVVLLLVEPQGRTQPVLMNSLVEDVATLDLGDESVKVTLAELDTLWSGHYLMVWRLQTTQPQIGPGTRGEAVKWLRRRLARFDGRPLPEGGVSDKFDAALLEDVKGFQRSHNLSADGIVGRLTMPHLNNLAPAVNRPFLNPHYAAIAQ